MAKENNNNNNFLVGIIILLLMIIAVWAFFYGKNMWNTTWGNNTPTNNVNTWNTPVQAWETPTVTIISDTRCGATCDTNELVGKLKEIPTLATAEITQMDYSDEGAKKALESAWITTLPAAIFSNNSVAELAQFLKATEDFKFSLELGSTYDPTIERSEKGFTVVEESKKELALANSHYTGAKDWKIVWIEYTDVNCHYCKKMETDGTAKEVLAKFPNDVKKSSVNFIWVWWAATQNAAEAFECVAKVWWAEAYAKTISQSLSTGKNGVSDIYGFATESWADAAKVEACVKAGETKEMVASKFAAGQNIFGITWTPGNVIINTETGEYEVISGAYPAASFIDTIERMLK